MLTYRVTNVSKGEDRLWNKILIKWFKDKQLFRRGEEKKPKALVELQNGITTIGLNCYHWSWSPVTEKVEVPICMVLSNTCLCHTLTRYTVRCYVWFANSSLSYARRRCLSPSRKRPSSSAPSGCHRTCHSVVLVLTLSCLKASCSWQFCSRCSTVMMSVLHWFTNEVTWTCVSPKRLQMMSSNWRQLPVGRVTQTQCA